MIILVFSGMVVEVGEGLGLVAHLYLGAVVVSGTPLLVSDHRVDCPAPPHNPCFYNTSDICHWCSICSICSLVYVHGRSSTVWLPVVKSGM